MAKLKFKKIEIIALITDSKNVVERLQRRGAVELVNIEDEELIKMNTNAETAQFERSISLAQSALEFLDKCSGYKPPFTAALSGREAVSTDAFAERKENADKLMSLCRTINDYSKKISALESENIKLQTKYDMIKAWTNLKMPMGFSETKCTSVFTGTYPGNVDARELEENIFNECGTRCFAEVVFSSKEQSGITVICLKEDSEAVFENLRDGGFALAGGNKKLAPSEEMSELKKNIDDNLTLKNNYIGEVKSLIERRGDIKFLIDFLILRRDKYEAINKLAVSKNTVIISGWIPEKYSKGLIEEFDKKYTCAVSLRDPDEDDDVPVLLKNGGFSEPVEGITEMYAMPNRHDVDPNPVMAFFYYLFFGMMLSDAGYGLMMVIVTAIVLKKFKVEGTLKRSLVMFKYCGISTLFWGALFGSWFGDLPQTIASNFFGVKIATTALWFEPLNDPIKLLLFSFLLGIVHLFVGLGVSFKMQWDDGKRLDAFLNVVPVYITIIGVAPIAASILADVPPVYITVGKYLALAGVILLVLTAGRSGKNLFMRFFGGLYALYNTATGYLSDILSYSRLLALGLATGSIASVINLIATMPSNTTVKAICLIVVGILGHTANMGINMLGAYVHADRLQFVEFFSKFYEGGGRMFKPLKANTKYIKFEKENIYE